MGACASGGGPFKEGYNVVSGIDKYPARRRVHPRLPADPPGPPERPDHAPEEDRRREGSRHAPWYRAEVERDVMIPVLGPDLIDLRLLEITAEKTAAGPDRGPRGHPGQADPDRRPATVEAPTSVEKSPPPDPGLQRSQGPEQARP